MPGAIAPALAGAPVARAAHENAGLAPETAPPAAWLSPVAPGSDDRGVAADAVTRSASLLHTAEDCEGAPLGEGKGAASTSEEETELAGVPVGGATAGPVSPAHADGVSTAAASSSVGRGPCAVEDCPAAPSLPPIEAAAEEIKQPSPAVPTAMWALAGSGDCVSPATDGGASAGAGAGAGGPASEVATRGAGLPGPLLPENVVDEAATE